jgi:glycosyltransferase involved in cell wall biosynthesis
MQELDAAAPATRPSVTCVLPFLDGQRFLPETIESVLSQTYTDWELLLVDDGSQAAATAIAEGYASRHPQRIRYLQHPRHENRGVCASRNLGIEHARGNFIAFLDADDVWQPRKLEEQVALLTAHPSVGMVYGRPLRWHRWPGHPEDAPEDFFQDLAVPANSVVTPPHGVVVLLVTHYIPIPSDVLIRSDVIREIGGFDDQSFTGKFQYHEDQAFLVKILLRYPVFASDACWTWYRRHDESCVAVVLRSGWHEDKRRFFLKWLEGYLAEQELRYPEVETALRESLAPPPPPPPRLSLGGRVLARVKEVLGAARG